MNTGLRKKLRIIWQHFEGALYLLLTYLCKAHGAWFWMQESRTYWFNPSTLEVEEEFMLIGLVLGLAIYNAVLLDFPLPIALYRKLLGQPAGMRDLADMDPTLGKSLMKLLEVEGERAFTTPASALVGSMQTQH